MAEALYQVVENRTKETLQAANFVSITSDKVTTVDNQSWLCCHGYVVINQKRVPLLLGLLCIVDGCGAKNLMVIILELILSKGGLIDGSIGEKLVCFGTYGHPLFQGVINGVTTQLKKGYVPYMILMHCVAHYTNLAASLINALPIMKSLENLVQKAYGFFTDSPRCHLELSRLSTLLETKGQKLVKNVKTQWMGILSCIERKLAEYKPLILQMSEDAPSVAAARQTLKLFLDIQNVLALPLPMPMPML